MCSQIHWHIIDCVLKFTEIDCVLKFTDILIDFVLKLTDILIDCVLKLTVWTSKSNFYAFWRHKDILIVYRSGSFCLLWSLLANFSFVLVQIHSAGWKIAANLSWVWSRLKKICTINKLLLVLSFSKKLLILCRVAAKIFVFVILRNL